MLLFGCSSSCSTALWYKRTLQLGAASRKDLPVVNSLRYCFALTPPDVSQTRQIELSEYRLDRKSNKSGGGKRKRDIIGNEARSCRRDQEVMLQEALYEGAAPRPETGEGACVCLLVSKVESQPRSTDETLSPPSACHTHLPPRHVFACCTLFDHKSSRSLSLLPFSRQSCQAMYVSEAGDAKTTRAG